MLGVANPWNRSAGKIKAVSFEVENGFHHIGVHDVARVADGSRDCGDLGGRLFEECGDGGINGRRINQRLIALDIDEDVAFLVGRDFRDAFCACPVVSAGHTGFAAEGANRVDYALVIGRYDNVMNGLSLLGALVYALDHGLAGERD